MKIAIVGGGASGLVTAIYAKNEKNEIFVFEKKKDCGKKILITGNGRCNYWNENQELSRYHSEDEELLPQVITKENQHEILNFFTNLGIIPKNKNGYYYPYSNQASSIRNALLLEAKNKGVKFLTDVSVIKVCKKNEIFQVFTENEVYQFDQVVLANGSNASLKNGEFSNGYNLAKSFDLTVIEPLPSLVQLISKGAFLKKWAGVRCEAKVSIYKNSEFLKEDFGEVQLTDYGISGICVFNLSRYASLGLSHKEKINLKINFLPFLKENVDTFLTRQNTIVKNRTIKEILECILNYKLVETILDILKIEDNKYYQDLTKEEREKLEKYLTSFPLEIIGTKEFSNAQVSCGGVRLNEVNLETMESLKNKGLYVVGELLDVDGECGGYNLGFAWMSGMLAGRDINKKSKKEV